jgi:hypothetical protein
MMGLLFCAGIGGICLLKIRDIFKQAVAMNSRSRMWLVLSASMFFLFITIIGATGIGISLKEHKFSSIQIPIPFHANINEQNRK